MQTYVVKLSQVMINNCCTIHILQICWTISHQISNRCKGIIATVANQHCNHPIRFETPVHKWRWKIQLAPNKVKQIRKSSHLLLLLYSTFTDPKVKRIKVNHIVYKNHSWHGMHVNWLLRFSDHYYEALTIMQALFPSLSGLILKCLPKYNIANRISY